MALPYHRPKPSRTRSRRLRKKLHLDEFQMLGFDLKFGLHASATSKEIEQIFNHVLDQAETRDLRCGGGGGPKRINFFVTRDNASTTVYDRAYLLQVVNSLALVIQVDASNFIDAHYPDDP